jgi:hypothetical protein
MCWSRFNSGSHMVPPMCRFHHSSETWSHQTIYMRVSGSHFNSGSSRGRLNKCRSHPSNIMWIPPNNMWVPFDCVGPMEPTYTIGGSHIGPTWTCVGPTHFDIHGSHSIVGPMRGLSYGPPWAHYLGGCQDRLLGGPLGLPGLRYTAPEGVEHKDYTGVVLG